MSDPVNTVTNAFSALINALDALADDCAEHAAEDGVSLARARSLEQDSGHISSIMANVEDACSRFHSIKARWERDAERDV